MAPSSMMESFRTMRPRITCESIRIFSHILRDHLFAAQILTDFFSFFPEAEPGHIRLAPSLETHILYFLDLHGNHPAIFDNNWSNIPFFAGRSLALPPRCQAGTVCISHMDFIEEGQENTALEQHLRSGSMASQDRHVDIQIHRAR